MADKVNAEKIKTVFTDFGMVSPQITPDLFLEEGNIVRIGIPPVRIGHTSGHTGKTRAFHQLEPFNNLAYNHSDRILISRSNGSILVVCWMKMI